MTKKKTAAVVLAAGLGTRMKSAWPKVLHPLAGRPMIGCLLETLESLDPEPLVVVVGPGMEAVGNAAAPHPTVVQTEQLGTGHAALCAMSSLEGFAGTVLIMFGDTPLLTPGTLAHMIDAREDGAAVVVLGFRPHDPGPYGRLMVTDSGELEAIVEARDATPEHLAVDLCNSGVMAVDGEKLGGLLRRIGTDNARGEYYLTDIVAMARGDGLDCAMVEGDAEELLGINTRADLALAEAIVQDRLRDAAMDGGATLTDPTTVWFSHDTQLGRDVTVGPNVVFGPGVSVGDSAEIKAFSHLEGATIAPGATIGPFARLRPGAHIGEGARVGNFVEIKNATLAAGAKANHLAYIGDAQVGAKANVGAGTITCNYDGVTKSTTVIGDGAFIGSNTALIAPVTIGDGAMIGAGSVIAKDVAPGAIAITRSEQKEIPGGAERFLERKKAAKKAETKKTGNKT